MNSDSELMDAAEGIFEKRGKAALEKAIQEILSCQYNHGILASALEYFATVTLKGVLPVFPALLSLSCEAVGGNSDRTTSVGAALVLIAGAADIHDDIIDQSQIKYSKKTVFGKFGSTVALLAGDELLIQGLILLQRECEPLSKKQKETILNLLWQALVEISQAEAKEARLMKKTEVHPKEYFELIRKKAVVPDLHCKIGSIIGNGNESTIEALGHYGRTFGIVSLVREEFIDLLEYPELRNRLTNECPPLPLLYALQNSEINKEVKSFIENSNLTKKEASRITKIVMDSCEVKELKKDMNLRIEEELRQLPSTIVDSIKTEAHLILKANAKGF